MRKALLYILLMALCLSSCGVPAEEPEAPPYSLEGTVFTYRGKDYDLTGRSPGITSILSCEPVGRHLVLEGHAGPQNGVYCVFDTEAEAFEKDIEGCNLIWRDGDITTAVYSCWGDVFDYDGNLLGSCALEEGGQIYALEFSGEAVRAEVLTLSGDSEEALFSLTGTPEVHTLSEGGNVTAHEAAVYCGNTTVTITKRNEEPFSFWGDDSIALTDLLRYLDYSEGTCRCVPEYTVDTDFGGGYGVSLSEGYVRYDGSQAVLTAEQVELIQGIIDRRAAAAGVKAP